MPLSPLHQHSPITASGILDRPPASTPGVQARPLKVSDVLIQRIGAACSREEAQRHGILYWPEPLPTPDTQLAPDPLVLFTCSPEREPMPRSRQTLVPLSVRDLVARRNWQGQKPLLQIPLGLIDKPEVQQRETLLVDLHGSAGALTGGPLLLVGAPNSGKGSALQTLLLWLTARYFPGQFCCAVLDPLHDLDLFRSLPHLHDDRERSLWNDGATDEQVQQFAQHCLSLIEQRRELLPRQYRGDDMLTRLWSQGVQVPLFLIVLSQYQRFFDRPMANNALKKLALSAIEARDLGVYVVCSSAEVGMRYLPLDLLNRVGTRISLYLGEPQRLEYFGRYQSMDPIPGRGLLMSNTRTLHHIQLALPTPGNDETERYESLQHALRWCAQT